MTNKATTLVKQLEEQGMNLRVVNPDTLEPAEFNPGEHPEQQLQELSKSHGKFKYFKNIVVWNGQAIAGKGMLEAAQKEGLSAIVINDRSDLTEEEAKELCAADRLLPALGTTNPEKLQEILDGLPNFEDIPGLTPGLLEELGIGVPDVEFKEFDESIADGVELCHCPNCGHEHAKKK